MLGICFSSCNYSIFDFASSFPIKIHLTCHADFPISARNFLVLLFITRASERLIKKVEEARRETMERRATGSLSGD